MIYAGYAVCKWLHGDLLQRAMLLSYLNGWRRELDRKSTRLNSSH